MPLTAERKRNNYLEEWMPRLVDNRCLELGTTYSKYVNRLIRDDLASVYAEAEDIARGRELERKIVNNNCSRNADN